ncbi:MAG: hypothetical protein CMN31_20135 [Sandaracinus sp.]|nr:hypothetical protein [Sandaracinus sp.]HJL35003.1 cell division protein FtsL [Polyangiaceae bacterium LLY-WYZ-15_(1-7)]
MRKNRRIEAAPDAPAPKKTILPPKPKGSAKGSVANTAAKKAAAKKGAAKKGAAKKGAVKKGATKKPLEPAASRSPRRAPRSGLAARFMMLWIAAVLATAAAFVVHLAMRFETVRLGYEVGAARREQRRLIEQKRLLAIEAATLRQAPRVETVARGELEMDVPEPERIVPIVPQRRSRARAGRVR